MKFHIDDYKIISFHKSDRPMKKYYVTIKGIEKGDEHKVYFGAIKSDGTPYEQYRDSTPLGLYSKYDHNDTRRLSRYVNRHLPFDLDYISPNVLSLLYLWNEE